MQQVFVSLKNSLCYHVILCVTCQTDSFVLCTDASGKGVRGVYYVHRKDKLLPTAFYSRQLRGPERRFSATEIEALATVTSIKHFAHYLCGAKFHVITDHRALPSFMSSRTLNRRLRSWAVPLHDYDFEVIYRPCDQNKEADSLSCQAWSDHEGRQASS